MINQFAPSNTSTDPKNELNQEKDETKNSNESIYFIQKSTSAAEKAFKNYIDGKFNIKTQQNLKYPEASPQTTNHEDTQMENDSGETVQALPTKTAESEVGEEGTLERSPSAAEIAFNSFIAGRFRGKPAESLDFMTNPGSLEETTEPLDAIPVVAVSLLHGQPFFAFVFRDTVSEFEEVERSPYRRRFTDTFLVQYFGSTYYYFELFAKNFGQ